MSGSSCQVASSEWGVAICKQLSAAPKEQANNWPCLPPVGSLAMNVVFPARFLARLSSPPYLVLSCPLARDFAGRQARCEASSFANLLTAQRQRQSDPQPTEANCDIVRR